MNPDTPDPSEVDPVEPAAAGNGASRRPAEPAAQKKVTSGLAKRRNPALAAVGEFLANLKRIALKDPLSLFLLLASIGLAITFAVLLGDIKPASSGTQVPLTTVQTLAKQKQVAAAVLLDHDSRVELTTTTATPQVSPSGVVSAVESAEQSGKGLKKESTLAPGVTQKLWAAYPASGAQTQQLLRELGAGGAIVTIDQQSGKGTKAIVVQFLILILLLVCLFSLFTRLGGEGGAGAGLASPSPHSREGTQEGQGLAGQDHLRGRRRRRGGRRRAPRDSRLPRRPQQVSRGGGGCTKGVLLVGPPGTGKTLLAKAVAGEADAAFFSLSGSDFVESLVGVGAARVRDLFRKARKVSPAIIFIDELDAAGRKRGAGIGQGNDEREQTLNQILVEMDGFGGDGGLVVMGATNRPDILDPALLRPGRFDRQVVVDEPDVHGRLEMLRLHGGKRRWRPDASLEEVARQTRLQRRRAANVHQRGGAPQRRDGRGESTRPRLRRRSTASWQARQSVTSSQRPSAG